MGFPRSWLQRGWRARLLWPVAQCFEWLVRLRQALYRLGLLKSQRIARKVVIVGNVVAGGAGKTPVVIEIVRHLRARGIAAGVVSRGYGRRSTDCREVLPDADAAQVGDEPLLIRRATGAPVVVGVRRADAAALLVDRHPEVQVVVSDDGLQHLALQRDVEICVFDERGIGNGWLLPAGPLREPWPRHCDLVLHTGNAPAFGGFHAPRRLAAHAVRRDGTRQPLQDLRAMRVVAVAGIARPSAFFDMLRAAGLDVAHCVALPDHASFDGWADPIDGPFALLCTEKDAPKLWRHAPHALAVPLLLDLPSAFLSTLDAKLSSPDGHQAA